MSNDNPCMSISRSLILGRRASVRLLQPYSQSLRADVRWTNRCGSFPFGRNLKVVVPNHIAGSAYYGDGVPRITQMSDSSCPFEKLYGRGAGWSNPRSPYAPLTGGVGLPVAGSVHDFQKRPHDTGIELGPRVLLDLPEGGFPGDAVTVGPGTDHRIERVGHRDYPCYQGYVLAAQPVGISVAVEALVMVLDDRQRGN